MSDLQVFINNEVVFEFDRNFSVGDEQLAFLDKMDADMDKGIKIYGELLKNPDSQQRATFVTMNLIRALKQDNDAIITASCAYLLNRNPDLIEVHANDHEQSIKIEFITEEE